jgi:hypothetical protein
MKSAKLTARALAGESLNLGSARFLASVCLLPLCALAGNSQAAAGVSLLPTKVPDVFVYSQPDRQFDAVSASDEELASAGFPPRPDPDEAPEAYEHWSRMVGAHHVRIENPDLTMSELQHRVPAYLAKSQPAAEGASTLLAAGSSNWSGFVAEAAKGTFTANESYTFTEFVVPVAQQAFGTCTGGWDYMAFWTGFDGVDSADLLQAGIDVNAYCKLGVTSTHYAAWYEWFPYNSTLINNMPVAPGDLMAVEVYYTTTAPHGHAYIVNRTEDKEVSIAFNPPAGAEYEGKSVEWIVEAPKVNGSQSTLSNYVGLLSSANFASNSKNTGVVYAGSAPAGMTSYNVTMTDSHKLAISQCSLLSVMAVQCENEGPAL